MIKLFKSMTVKDFYSWWPRKADTRPDPGRPQGLTLRNGKIKIVFLIFMIFIQFVKNINARGLVTCRIEVQ